MRFALPLLMLTLLLPACGTVNSYVQSAAAKLEHATNPDAPPRPGLAPLYQPPPSDRADGSPPPPPEAVAPEDLPFPPRLIGEDEAEALLAGDPAALRFLAVRRLAETGLIPTDDAALRANTNMAALLPLTTTPPPAAGLFTPAPAPSAMEKAMRDLWNRPDTKAQRDFLVDNLLPKAPEQRQAMVIPDKQSARRALERLGRLHDAGLIDRPQKETESAAVKALLDGNALPETLVVAPPPPPVQPVKPKKSSTGRSGSSSGSGSSRPMERLQGGVTGELKVIPSPPEINAPPLPVDFAGQVGIHLLSMGSASHAEQAWKSLTTEHPELAALTYKVVRADLGELGVTHRLIAGPLTTAKAAELCAALKPKGQTCAPTPFPP